MANPVCEWPTFPMGIFVQAAEIPDLFFFAILFLHARLERYFCSFSFAPPSGWCAEQGWEREVGKTAIGWFTVSFAGADPRVAKTSEPWNSHARRPSAVNRDGFPVAFRQSRARATVRTR